MDEEPRIALVQDALPFIGGAERTLEATLELYPDAPIFALVYEPRAFRESPISRHMIHTSFIDRLPGGRRHYRKYLPLLPMAIEQFDLNGYDLILSFSYAVAHGVLARADQLHIAYMHTPLRYAWDGSQPFAGGTLWNHGLLRWAARLLLHYLRLWDQSAGARVDSIAAASRWTAQRVWRAYRRKARVIYPPVDVERFRSVAERDGYYLTISRLVPYKRTEVVVEAFSKLGLPFMVVGEGPERRRLEAQAAPNVRFLGRQPDEVATELLQQARAFVYAAEEDFGIVLVEAQAAGCPVIAYGRGGALETVIEGASGRFFMEQSVDCLVEAVEEFDRDGPAYDPHIARRNAERFSKARFQQELAGLLNEEWKSFLDRA